MLRVPIWLIALALAGCGSSPPSRPAPRAAGGERIAPSVPITSNDPRRPLDRLAVRLSDLAIDELSLAPSDAEAPCREVMPPFDILSALTDGGEAVSCLVGERGAACVHFVDHEPELAEQALCGETAEAVDVPDRVRAIAAVAQAGWRIAPIPAPTGHRALSVRTGSDYYLMVRRGRAWTASPRKVASTDGRQVGPERLLDSRGLTEDPSFALVASSYRGSNQQGELVTRLFILSDQLAERAVRDIGLLVWTLDPAAGADDQQSTSTLRSRPHLELLLEPEITPDGLLELQVIRDHRPEPERARFQDRACKPGGAGDLLGLACPLDRIELLMKQAGRWRSEAGQLVRERP